MLYKSKLSAVLATGLNRLRPAFPATISKPCTMFYSRGWIPYSRSRMRLPAFVSSFLLATLLVPVAAGHADVSPSKQAEAAKMNNLGTALMNQQIAG